MLSYGKTSQNLDLKTGVPVSVLRRSQFSGLRLRLDESNTKRHPNTSMYTITEKNTNKDHFITYPLGGGYVLFYTVFLTALSLSLSLFLSFFHKFLFGITRPLLERE